MPYRIRNAIMEDAPIITAIVRESFRDVALRFGLTADNCPKHPSNCQLAWIEAAVEKGVAFFILEADRRPIGTIALEQADAGTGYLERLAVLPSCRRRGLGRRLVEHAISDAMALNLKRIDIGIISAQAELQRWYENFGFVALRQAVFDHLPFEVLFMSKTL